MNPTDELIAALGERVEHEAAALRQVVSTFDEHTIAIIKFLHDCHGMVFVTGAGTSGAIARRMAHLFAVSGTPATFLHPADALHGTMGAIRQGDVVVAISRGGGSAELNSLVERARQRGASVVALTNDPSGALAGLVDHVQLFATPPDADPGELFAMGTNLMHAVWGDAVAAALMRLRGYSWEDVLFTHPSGAVGTMSSAPEVLEPLTPPWG